MYGMLSNGGGVELFLHFLTAVAISTIDTSSLLNPTVGVKKMASMQAGQCSEARYGIHYGKE